MKSFTAFLLVVFSNFADAQKLPDTLIKGNTFIRFNALGLADISEPNISFGVEKRIGKRISLAFDAAYIVYSERFHSSGRSSGFILRPAMRYYPDNSRIFLEAELHYKQHTHHIRDWIGHDIVEGVPSYEVFEAFRLRKKVVGPHLKMGRLIPVTQRLWLEAYIGLGVHFRKYTVVGNPDLIYRFNQNFNEVTTGETVRLMAFPAGWRVLYRLR